MRLNLVPNPSFKTNTAFWSFRGTGATITRVIDAFYIGSSCLVVTKGTGAGAGAATDRLSVTPSMSYAASGYVEIPTGQEASTLNLTVEWYTALVGGSLIATTNSTIIALTDADGWYRLAAVATSPNTAVAAVVTITEPTVGTVGQIYRLDAVLLEQSSYVEEYFDDMSQGKRTTLTNTALAAKPAPLFTGLRLAADVALGSLVFNTIDENNVIWVITDIEGWWVHPDPEMPDLPRGYGDGSYDVHGRYQARQITLSGSFFPPAPSYTAAAREKLIEATDLVYKGAWLRTSEKPTKASYVRLSGRPNIATTDAGGRTNFSIGLRAGDPIKYEWVDGSPDGYNIIIVPVKNVALSRTGEVTIVNTGNVAVPMIFELTGPVVGKLTITNVTRNEVITVVGSLGSTDILELDTYNREVALNGVLSGARQKVDIVVSWIQLSPGSNVIRFADLGAVNSTASVRAFYRSGWLG